MRRVHDFRRLLIVAAFATAFMPACGNQSSSTAPPPAATPTTLAPAAPAPATPTPSSPTPTSPATPKDVEWHLAEGGDWVPSGEPPPCPSPLVLDTPVDLSLVTSVLYPGQPRGPAFKPHGGFRFDNQ